MTKNMRVKKEKKIVSCAIMLRVVIYWIRSVSLLEGAGGAGGSQAVVMMAVETA